MADFTIPKGPASPETNAQLLNAVSDTQSWLTQARSVLHIVIDALPPMEQGRIANALEAVVGLLDLAQQSTGKVEHCVCCEEVRHA